MAAAGGDPRRSEVSSPCMMSDKRPKLERAHSAVEKENVPLLQRSNSLLRRQYSQQEPSSRKEQEHGVPGAHDEYYRTVTYTSWHRYYTILFLYCLLYTYYYHSSCCGMTPSALDNSTNGVPRGWFQGFRLPTCKYSVFFPMPFIIKIKSKMYAPLFQMVSWARHWIALVLCHTHRVAIMYIFPRLAQSVEHEAHFKKTKINLGVVGSSRNVGITSRRIRCLLPMYKC